MMHVPQYLLKEVLGLELPMKVALSTDESHWMVAGSLDAKEKKNSFLKKFLTFHICISVSKVTLSWEGELPLYQNCWYSKWFGGGEVILITQASPGPRNAFELVEAQSFSCWA